MAALESQCLLPSRSATLAYGTGNRRSPLRARLTTRRGMQAIVFASAAAILFCALASLLPSHLARTSLLAASSKPSSSSLHVTESPIPVITTEINKANHELGQAAAKQAEDVQIDDVEHDSFKQEVADAHRVAKLEGKLAESEKKPAAAKAVAAVEVDLKRIEVQEAGLELGEHALHKDQAAEVELQNTIFEEEAAIAEAEKNKNAVSTQEGHLKADLVTEAHLRGKINTETSEFTAAVHSYEHDFSHVLGEEDALEKQLISDVDHPDQAEVHKALLDAHAQQSKEDTAVDKEVEGDEVVAHDFEDLSKDDQQVSHQEEDNAAAAGLSSSAAHSSAAHK